MSRRHTILMLAAAWREGRNARWLYPLSMGTTIFALAGLVGGLATSGSAESAVQQVSKQAADDPHFALVLSPARTANPSWYDIVYGAALPLTVAAVDGESKTIRFGPTINLTGDRSADLAQIEAE